MSAWQPISTAPRDGSPIMAYCPKERRRKTRLVRSAAATLWQIVLRDGQTGRFCHPTHWRPVPSPLDDGRRNR